jgi:hypothetical protein
MVDKDEKQSKSPEEIETIVTLCSGSHLIMSQGQASSQPTNAISHPEDVMACLFGRST